MELADKDMRARVLNSLLDCDREGGPSRLVGRHTTVHPVSNFSVGGWGGAGPRPSAVRLLKGSKTRSFIAKCWAKPGMWSCRGGGGWGDEPSRPDPQRLAISHGGALRVSWHDVLRACACVFHPEGDGRSSPAACRRGSKPTPRGGRLRAMIGRWPWMLA